MLLTRIIIPDRAFQCTTLWYIGTSRRRRTNRPGVFLPPNRLPRERRITCNIGPAVFGNPGYMAGCRVPWPTLAWPLRSACREDARAARRQRQVSYLDRALHPGCRVPWLTLRGHEGLPAGKMPELREGSGRSRTSTVPYTRGAGCHGPRLRDHEGLPAGKMPGLREGSGRSRTSTVPYTRGAGCHGPRLPGAMAHACVAMKVCLQGRCPSCAKAAAGLVPRPCPTRACAALAMPPALSDILRAGCLRCAIIEAELRR